MISEAPLARKEVQEYTMPSVAWLYSATFNKPVLNILDSERQYKNSFIIGLAALDMD